MAVSYNELTEILLRSGETFEVQEIFQDGTIHTYRGKNISAFIQRSDKRDHEHKVFDQTGNLVYHRDRNGKLHVGSSKQWQKALRQAQIGRTTVSGAEILADSWRRALRMYGIGRR